VWKDNRRRHSEVIPTFDVLHKYGHDYKVIFVGDASMSPYEIASRAARSSTGIRRRGGLARPGAAAVAERDMDQPDAREALGLHALDAADPRPLRWSACIPLTLAGLEAGDKELSRKH
jgi:hypothetical protein